MERKQVNLFETVNQSRMECLVPLQRKVKTGVGAEDSTGFAAKKMVWMPATDPVTKEFIKYVRPHCISLFST